LLLLFYETGSKYHSWFEHLTTNGIADREFKPFALSVSKGSE